MKKYKIIILLHNEESKTIYTNNLKQYKNLLKKYCFKLYENINGEYILEGLY